MTKYYWVSITVDDFIIENVITIHPLNYIVDIRKTNDLNYGKIYHHKEIHIKNWKEIDEESFKFYYNYLTKL